MSFACQVMLRICEEVLKERPKEMDEAARERKTRDVNSCLS